MAHSDAPTDPDPDRWTVAVDGAVDDPQSLRVADLASMETVPVSATTDCDGDRPSERWAGVRVGTLVDRAAPDADASHALVRTTDPDFTCGFALDRLRDAVLAVRLDGEPIPADRGGPVRLLVDDADCWERVKWVTGVAVLDGPPGDADTAQDCVPAGD